MKRHLYFILYLLSAILAVAVFISQGYFDRRWFFVFLVPTIVFCILYQREKIKDEDRYR